MVIKAFLGLLIAALGIAFLGCENRLRPKTAVVQRVDDSSISRMAKAALLNEPGTRTADVRIETVTGTVMLSGSVLDETQLQRVFQIVSAIAGVKRIYNRLIVKQSGNGSSGNGSLVRSQLIKV